MTGKNNILDEYLLWGNSHREILKPVYDRCILICILKESLI